MQKLKENDTLHGLARSQREQAESARAAVEKLFAEQSPLALYLDIDGTLLDMALTPSTVHVPPDLADMLARTTERLSGALAIVTGRPIAEADQLLKPLKFAAAGVHGAEMRTTATGEIASLTPAFNPALLNDLRTIAEAMPGIVTENKGAGIAMHYRLVPDLREPLLATVEALLPKYPGQFAICGGRKVIEILPVGFSKGVALHKLAGLSQFKNRIPVMIGDDIADMEAFRAAESLGGVGLKVAGENFTKAEASFGGAPDVRSWLRKLNGDL
jgi:trehalose 6-phosphate phosphatase